MTGAGARLAAFVLFIVAAITDYWDGHLARTRNLVTDLGRLLDPLARDTTPFTGCQPPKHVRHVEPRLVCEVEFVEWTATRTLRAPSYKGIRDDVEPSQCVFDPGA